MQLPSQQATLSSLASGSARVWVGKAQKKPTKGVCEEGSRLFPNFRENVPKGKGVVTGREKALFSLDNVRGFPT